MQNLIIIGARGYGIEVSNLAKHCTGFNKTWRIKGFLDDKSSLDNLPYPILSSVENYLIEPNDVFICALGSVQYKHQYIQLIKAKNGQFINLVSEKSIIESDLSGSEGIIVDSFCIIGNNVSIGSYVTLQAYTALGHDCRIGDYCHLSAYTFVGGCAVLQDNVQAYTRATIIPSITVNSNAVIGAGSVVFKNVPADVTVIGNPAQILHF
jgi:sugar O-acyltransferase (sialic acid O-acetyltransferase NeuD family)